MNKTQLKILAKEVKQELMALDSDERYTEVLNNVGTPTPLHAKFHFFLAELKKYGEKPEDIAFLKDDFWTLPIKSIGSWLTPKMYGDGVFSLVFVPKYKRPWCKST